VEQIAPARPDACRGHARRSQQHQQHEEGAGERDQFRSDQCPTAETAG
jgi:hypothetical protein